MAEKFDPYYTWLGIPPEDQPPDHYRLLGVRRFENNLEVISNALDQRMVHIRSLLSGEHKREAEQILRELATAGECLRSAERKGAYDRDQRQKDAPKLGRSQSSAHFARPAAPHPSAPPSHATPGAANPLSATPGGAVPAPILPAASGPFPTGSGAYPVHMAQGSQAAIPGARFLGGPAPGARPSPVAAPHLSGTNMPVAVAQPTVAGSAPVVVAAGSPKPAVPWQPLVLLAAGGAVLLTLGGVVLVVALIAAGVFSSKPGKNQEVVKKPAKSTELPIQQFPIRPPPKETTPPKETVPRDPTPEPGESNPQPPSVETIALAPVVANIGAPLDLLHDFDRTKQVERGKVMKFGDVWQTEGRSLDQMVFHVDDLPEEYMVEAIVIRQRDTRRGGDDGVVQGLVVGDQQCMVTVDGFNPAGMRTALDLIDGKQAGSSKDECEYRGQLLTRRKDTVIQYYVFKDRLAVVCDGKTVLDWTGGMNRLSLNPKFKTSDPKALFFATWQGMFALKKLEVRAIGAEGEPPPTALVGISSVPKTPIEDPPVVVKTPTPEPQPVVAKKLTPPDSDDRSKARVTIRNEYKISDNLKPTDKSDLADKLLTIAKTETMPANLYVLLEEARDLEIGAGEMLAAFHVVDKIVANFETDPWETKLAALKVAAPKATQFKQRKELAHIAYQAALGSMAAAKFESAEAAAGIAKEAAERSGDTAIKKDALELRIAAEAAKKQEETAQVAFDKLKAVPDDADANEAWGKFACLVKRDWNEGLPHLAKGNDAILKEAAVTDANQPAESVDQSAAADKWWQAADDLKGREKDSALLRAREWYEKALPAAAGIAKERAQTRIKETEALYAKNSISDANTPSIPGATPGLVGRILIDSKDSRVSVKYEPGYELNYDDVVKQLEAKYNVTGRTLKIEMAGRLLLFEKSEIEVHISKNSSFGGKGSSSSAFGNTTQLFIEGKDIQDLTVNRGRGGVNKFTLAKGEHLFVWTLGGSRDGTAELSFTNADDGKPIYVFFDQKMDNYYQTKPTNHAGELTFTK